MRRAARGVRIPNLGSPAHFQRPCLGRSDDPDDLVSEPVPESSAALLAAHDDADIEIESDLNPIGQLPDRARQSSPFSERSETSAP